MGVVAKLFRFITTLAGACLLVWLMRDRMVNLPRKGEPFVPEFRSAPPDHASPHADVTAIVGIGPVFAERLAGAGIDSVTDLAAATTHAVATAADVNEDTATGWIEQARGR